MSLGSPCGAPAFTHLTMVSICSSVSEGSFLKCWMPTVRSRCQGGMVRVSTRCLMAFAQGRASSNVTKDMGAIAPARWHSWQWSCRIGATSLAEGNLLLRRIRPVRRLRARRRRDRAHGKQQRQSHSQGTQGNASTISAHLATSSTKLFVLAGPATSRRNLATVQHSTPELSSAYFRVRISEAA